MLTPSRGAGNPTKLFSCRRNCMYAPSLILLRCYKTLAMMKSYQLFSKLQYLNGTPKDSHVTHKQLSDVSKSYQKQGVLKVGRPTTCPRATAPPTEPSFV
ncbi:hypothetical protein AVEN_87792-1 [Araneus ventricosus]|uniref:Uncharacterized protein n=1 Tax=Araneus ventricosus TaxID=182803 RepID=A0A4Y2BD74_ARAVE|nr:hypothetical protein AVEN_87792-1 [Araneus ventricosus]